jgi:hypothetical protein
VEAYSAVPDTYTVPFRSGLLIYVVPPGKRVVGMVDMIAVERWSTYRGLGVGLPCLAGC